MHVPNDYSSSEIGMKIQTALGAAILLLSGQVLAQDYYGAMAFCQKSGATSWARNYASQADAEKSAMAKCRELGGKQCQTLVWFKNGCGSIAIGEGRAAGSGWGTTSDRAQLEAMKSCSGVTRKCEIKHTSCTKGSGG